MFLAIALGLHGEKIDGVSFALNPCADSSIVVCLVFLVLVALTYLANKINTTLKFPNRTTHTQNTSTKQSVDFVSVLID